MRFYEDYTDFIKPVTVMISNNLSKDDVADLEEYFKIIIRAVKRKLRVELKK